MASPRSGIPSHPPALPRTALPGTALPGTELWPDHVLQHRRPWILAALVAVCVIPRVLHAINLDVCCDDGYYYLTIARAFENGDYHTTFFGIGLNLYPLVLAWLHRLGLDWFAVAEVWGVVTAGLTVLPLYGWVRRLYDERVAAATAFLYAAHPSLIELSIEPLRESTFWLLFSLVLYLSWRALDERRLWLFAAAGLAFALAIHTRTESWLLVAPLGLWGVFRWWEGASLRRLLAGTCVLVLMTPLLLSVANVVVLREHSQWEWGRLRHIEHVYNWCRGSSPDGTTVKPPPPLAVTGSTATAAGIRIEEPPPFPTGPEMVAEYAVGFHGHQNLVYHLLLGWGLLAGWRELCQRNRLALLPVALAVPASIAGYLLLWGAINARYFLTVFFVLGPLEGIALLHVADAILRFWRNRGVERVGRRIATIGVPAALVALLWSDALSSAHNGRNLRADLGRRLRQQHGPFASVVVDPGACAVGHFAVNGLPAVHFAKHPLETTIDREQPELIVLSPIVRAAYWGQLTEAEASARGYRLMPATDRLGELPAYLVYIRETRSPALPERTAAAVPGLQFRE